MGFFKKLFGGAGDSNKNSNEESKQETRLREKPDNKMSISGSTESEHVPSSKVKDDLLPKNINSFRKKKMKDLSEARAHKNESTEAKNKWKKADEDLKDLDRAIHEGAKSLEDLKKALPYNASLQSEIDDFIDIIFKENNKRDIADEFNDPRCRYDYFFVKDTNGVMSKHDIYSSFEGNCNLSSAYLPIIRTTKDCVFKGCESLEHVEISEKCKSFSISIESFMGCKSLKEIAIPSSVTDIHRSAFEGCISIGKIEIPD